jgi:hypothetical protein
MGPNRVGISLLSPEVIEVGSKGPNRVGVSLPSPEDRNRPSFRSVLFSGFQNTGRWTKSLNPVIQSVHTLLHNNRSMMFVTEPHNGHVHISAAVPEMFPCASESELKGPYLGVPQRALYRRDEPIHGGSLA